MMVQWEKVKKHLKNIASMRVECDEKIFEPSINDSRNLKISCINGVWGLKRRSWGVASMMVEAWKNDAQILVRSINGRMFESWVDLRAKQQP